MRRMRFGLVIGILAAGMVAGCGSEGSKAPPPSAANADVRQIREILQGQVAAMARGDLEGAKKSFVPAVREKITADVVAGAKKNLLKIDLEQFCAKVEPVGDREAIRVKNADDKTVLTLALQDGEWLAETLWFAEAK